MALPISQGSGATLASNIFDGAHHQIISPVSVYPLPASSSFIGLVSAASIHGKVELTTAIPAGANYIGLASVNVANTVPVSQSGTWNVGVTGLISLASGTKVGLDPGSSFIGLVTVANTLTVDTHAVTQSGTWNVGITGLTSLASGTRVGLNPGTNFIGLATAVVGNTVTVTAADLDVRDLSSAQDSVAAVQSGAWNISSLASGAHVNAHLQTGSNFIGGVSIFGAINLSQVTLNPSPNFIGLTTAVIGNTVTVASHAVTNAGTFAVQNTAAIPAGANYIGLATVDIGSIPTHPVTQSGNWAITSLASGAHIRAYLETGSNFIGGVSVFGNLAANLAGNVTLNPSPNFIGLVTIGNTVTVASHAVTNAGTFAVQNTAALPAGANYIGLATVDIGSIPTVTVNTHAVTQSGNWNITSLASGAHINTYQQNAIPAGTNNIGDVDVLTLPALPTGANFIGLVTANIVGSINTGMTTLFPGPNFIGLVTSVIGNTPAVTQSGTWNVGVTGLISLASGTLVGLNPSSNAIGKLAANSGVDIGDVDVTSLPALPAGANYIGLATVVVGNTVTVGSHAVTNAGTFAVQNTAATPAGANFIGLTTTVPSYSPVRSLYTSLATVISAAGNATLFVPPSGQRWVLKNLSITAQGRGEVELKSGTATVIPSMSLATTSGYAQYYGESGFPAKAADQSLVVNVLSAATLGVTALVRFE